MGSIGEDQRKFLNGLLEEVDEIKEHTCPTQSLRSKIVDQTSVKEHLSVLHEDMRIMQNTISNTRSLLNRTGALLFISTFINTLLLMGIAMYMLTHTISIPSWVMSP